MWWAGNVFFFLASNNIDRHNMQWDGGERERERVCQIGEAVSERQPSEFGGFIRVQSGLSLRTVHVASIRCLPSSLPLPSLSLFLSLSLPFFSPLSLPYSPSLLLHLIIDFGRVWLGFIELAIGLVVRAEACGAGPLFFTDARLQMLVRHWSPGNENKHETGGGT